MDRIKCPVLYLVFDVRQKSQRATILHEAHFLPCVCTLYTMACRSTQISKLRKQCVVAAAPIIIRKIYINSKNGHIMLVERGWSAKKVFVLIKFCWSCIHVVYWAFISSMGTRPILHWFHALHSVQFYWFWTGFCVCRFTFLWNFVVGFFLYLSFETTNMH